MGKGRTSPSRTKGISVVYMFLIETSCEDSDYDDDDDGRTDSWMDGFEKQRAQYRFSTTFPQQQQHRPKKKKGGVYVEVCLGHVTRGSTNTLSREEAPQQINKCYNKK